VGGVVLLDGPGEREEDPGIEPRHVLHVGGHPIGRRERRVHDGQPPDQPVGQPRIHRGKRRQPAGHPGKAIRQKSRHGKDARRQPRQVVKGRDGVAIGAQRGNQPGHPHGVEAVELPADLRPHGMAEQAGPVELQGVHQEAEVVDDGGKVQRIGVAGVVRPAVAAVVPDHGREAGAGEALGHPPPEGGAPPLPRLAAQGRPPPPRPVPAARSVRRDDVALSAGWTGALPHATIQHYSLSNGSADGPRAPWSSSLLLNPLPCRMRREPSPVRSLAPSATPRWTASWSPATGRWWCPLPGPRTWPPPWRRSSMRRAARRSPPSPSSPGPTSEHLRSSSNPPPSARCASTAPSPRRTESSPYLRSVSTRSSDSRAARRPCSASPPPPRPATVRARRPSFASCWTGSARSSRSKSPSSAGGVPARSSPASRVSPTEPQPPTGGDGAASTSGKASMAWWPTQRGSVPATRRQPS